MKKAKIIKIPDGSLSKIELCDLTLFEEKMSKIKDLKKMKQNIDKSFLEIAITELGLGDKKINAKRVKKICKKALIAMIEENRK